MSFYIINKIMVLNLEVVVVVVVVVLVVIFLNYPK